MANKRLKYNVIFVLFVLKYNGNLFVTRVMMMMMMVMVMILLGTSVRLFVSFSDFDNVNH